MTIKQKISAFIAVAIFCGIHSIAQTKTGFVIKGSIKGIGTGKVILLRYNESDRTSKGIDSVTLKNGVFELKGELAGPEMMSLQIKPGNWGINLFVENSVISIEADTTAAQHYDYTRSGRDKGATITKFTVRGSESQDQYNAFLNAPEQLKFKEQFADLNKRSTAEKDPVAKEKIKVESQAVGAANMAWQQKWINDFIAKNPSSATGIYLFNLYHQFDTSLSLATLETIVSRFSGKAKASVYYTSLIKELNNKKALSVGKVAPDFTLLQRDSTKITLSATRGKYMMIDFWASWCVPCRKAIPHWKEIYSKYHDKGLEIVSVANDIKWNDWTKAMDVEKMPWTQLIDEFPVKGMPSKVASLYGVHYIPFYVLLDKEGKILVYSGNEKDIDEKLAEVFH